MLLGTSFLAAHTLRSRGSVRRCSKVLAKAAKRPRWAPGSTKKGSTSTKEDDPWKMTALLDEVLPGDGRLFRVTYEEGIGLREGPDVDAPRTGFDLEKGAIVEIATEVRRKGRCFYELLNGGGWIFNWTEIDGERVELVEEAAKMYTIVFPTGIAGVEWGSDVRMTFPCVRGFRDDSAEALQEAGMAVGDILVMVNNDLMLGRSFDDVLAQVWATQGASPGGTDPTADTVFYKVTTASPFGIGIRAEPGMDAPRTGEDLKRGMIFEVSEMVLTEDGPTFLRLADGRGWVFDTSPIDPKNPSVIRVEDIFGPCSATMWRGTQEALMETLGFDKKRAGLSQEKSIVMTVLQEGSPPQQIVVESGVNLRKALVREKFEIYTDLARLTNCSAQQMCGTCVVQVVEGNDNLTQESNNELGQMAPNGPGFRLSCGVDVYGDCTVRIRPPGAIFGPGT